MILAKMILPTLALHETDGRGEKWSGQRPSLGGWKPLLPVKRNVSRRALGVFDLLTPGWRLCEAPLKSNFLSVIRKRVGLSENVLCLTGARV